MKQLKMLFLVLLSVTAQAQKPLPQTLVAGVTTTFAQQSTINAAVSSSLASQATLIAQNGAAILANLSAQQTTNAGLTTALNGLLAGGTLTPATATVLGAVKLGSRLFAVDGSGTINTVGNLSAYTNDVNFQTLAQVRQAIADSNQAHVTYFSPDFVGAGTIADPTRLATAPGTTLTVDATPVQNSTNAASSGSLYATNAGKANLAHAHGVNDVTGLSAFILSTLTGLPGYGPSNPYLTNNGTGLVWTAGTAGVSTTALTASSLTSSNQTYSTITLNWTSVSPNGGYTLATAQDAGFTAGVNTIYYGSSLSYTHTGLTGNTPYYYRIFANGTGNYTQSPPTYLTQATLATATPLATPTPALSGLGSNTLVASWSASGNATSYQLDQALDAGFTNNLSTVYSGAALTTNVTGLLASTPYFYRIRAVGSGDYAPSGYGLASATTTAAAVSQTALTASTISFAGISSSGATINWTAVPNATSYLLQRATDAAFSANLNSAVYAGTGLTFTDAALSASTLYYYRVKAVGSGNYTDSPQVSGNVTTPAGAGTPLAASTITLSGITATGLTATWTAVPNAVSYQLQRATDAGFTANLVTAYSGTALTFANTGLTASTTYYFRVKAIGNGTTFLDGVNSPTVSGATSAAGGTALAAVTNPNLNGVETTAITTVWASVPNATGYLVQQATNSGFTAGVTTVYTGTALTAKATGLAPQTVYYYRIRATGDGATFLDGAYSAVLTATTTASVAGTYAESKVVRVNLSTTASTTPQTGWNVVIAPGGQNVTPTVALTNATNLLTETGVGTGFAASVISGTFGAGNTSAFGGTANAANMVWPAVVLNRGWPTTNSLSAPCTMQISGLDPAKVYHLYVGAMGQVGATAYPLTITAGTLTRTVNANANPSDNVTPEFDSPALARFLNLKSDAGGNLSFAVSRACCQSTTLQGFVLKESNIPR